MTEPSRHPGGAGALDDPRRFLASLVESSEDAIIGKDRDGVIRSWNPAAERLYGYSAHEAVGQPITILAPPEGPGDIPAIMKRLRRGERIEHFETVRMHRDGHRLDVSLSVSPVHDEAGRVIGAATIARDITELKRAHLFDRLMADAGRALTAPIAASEGLQRLAELVADSVADFCIAYLADEEWQIRVAGRAHADPARKGALAELESLHPPASEGHPAREVIEEGEPIFLPELGISQVESYARGDAHSRVIHRLAPRSIVVLPLEVRGERLGALAFATVEGGRRPFGAADIPRLQEVARRAALFADSATLLERSRGSEERLHVALEAAQMGTWQWDMGSGTVHWSELLERIHGIPPGSFAGTFDAFRADIHPDDEARVVREIREAVERGGAYEIEYRIVRPDGEVRWLAASAALIEERSGRVARMVGVCADITQRKKAEVADRFLSAAGEVLNSSLDFETTLRRVAELAVPDVADWCGVDLLEEGVIRRVAVAHPDPEYRRLVEELARREPPSLDAPVGSGAVIRTGRPQILREITQEMLEQAARTGPEVQRLVESGHLRSILYVPLEAGGERFGALILAHGQSGRSFDDADLHLAEAIATRAATAIVNARLYRESRELGAQLERERARLAGIVERAPAIITVMTGPEHLFEAVNPHYYELIGKRDILGKPVREARPELEGQGYFEMLDRVYETGEPATGSGMPLTVRRAPDAEPEEVYLNITYQPLFGQGDEVTGVFAHAVDVTELVRARQRAEEAVRSRDDVLAYVSHDLRNFVGAVETGARTLLELPLDAKRAERGLERILGASGQALRLIDDLLDVARSDAGQLRLGPEELDAREAVEAALDAVRDAAESKRIELRREVDGSPAFLRADPHRLQRVFSNLLGNALRHTPEGGSVTIGMRQEGDEMLFRVSDTGPGIPPENRDRLFERYWQAERPERGKPGAGLGLTIARDIVRAHGGRIWVESEEGRGSTFHVALPLGGTDRD